MASLLCVPSTLTPTSITKSNCSLKPQPKSNSWLSIPSVHSQARDQSKKHVLPLFSPDHRPQTHLSFRLRASTETAQAIAETENSTTPIEFDQTVEHVVFLQMRDPEGKTKEESRQALKTALNSLKCLPGTLYLTAGYVGDTYGAPGPFNFFLHSRLATKKHRDRFMQHPLKYGFSMGFTEGLCDDFMMLDFIHKHVEPLSHPEYGCTLRFVYLKLKEGVGDVPVRGVLQKSYPGSLTQLTYGRIIEPCFTVPGTQADAVKGYNLGLHATFPSKATLYEVFGSPEALTQTLKDKLGETLVDDASVFIHDYNIDEVYGGTFV